MIFICLEIQILYGINKFILSSSSCLLPACSFICVLIRFSCVKVFEIILSFFFFHTIRQSIRNKDDIIKITSNKFVNMKSLITYLLQKFSDVLRIFSLFSNCFYFSQNYKLLHLIDNLLLFSFVLFSVLLFLSITGKNHCSASYYFYNIMYRKYILLYIMI